VLADHAPALGRKGGIGRSHVDALEIDCRRLLPPEKISKTMKWVSLTEYRTAGCHQGMQDAVRWSVF
jgi:ribosomal protein S12 methylthiotransferase